MPYCTHCGSDLKPTQDVCLNCGKMNAPQQRVSSQNDTGGFGWGLLGFCFPLVGLILYLVWKTERPLTAKACGLGALISVVISFGTYILYGLVIALSYAL